MPAAAASAARTASGSYAPWRTEEVAQLGINSLVNGRAIGHNQEDSHNLLPLAGVPVC
jgi:hypothetical protein